MAEAPFDPHSPAVLRARRIEARRRHRRRRAGAGVAILAAGAALAVVLAYPGGHGASRVRRLEAAGRPAPPKAPTPAAVRAQVARELAAQQNAAIDRLLARQPFIRAGGSERREIALTFDDGPGPYTPRLLDALGRLHAPATFFEVGFMFRWFHASAVRELRMGDVIGDHTETHPPMALLSPAAQLEQIVAQREWVSRYGGPLPRLWRPPYGSYNRATLEILKRLGMLMVLWTVDTDDYLRPGVSAIVRRALAGARPGAIILMHDGGGDRSQTIEAAPIIVRALRARGYRLVTVPQLILNDPPLGAQELPSRLAGD